MNRVCLALLLLLSTASCARAAPPTAEPSPTALASPTAVPAPAPGRAPPIEWKGPDPSRTIASANGVQVVNLGTAVFTGPWNAKAPATSPAGDGFITTIVLVSGAEPDPARFHVTDSVGASYATTYTPLARYDDLTIGATTFHGIAGPPKTFSLELGGARVELTRLVVDTPDWGRLTCCFGYYPLPLRVGSDSVKYQYLGGGAFYTFSVEHAGGVDEVHVATDMTTGIPRRVTKDELDQLMPKCPRCLPVGTPLPGHPFAKP